MNERIFVTGATGMVGFHVSKRLLSKGYQVVAGIRSTSKTDELRSLPATANQLTLAVSNLQDTSTLATAMHGCSVVVHCAGSVDPHARREDIVATNVGGTSSVLQAASMTGVRQFIHISSLSVITGQEDQFGIDESAPLRYCGEAYADSKVDAEKVVLGAEHGESNPRTTNGAVVEWTILRPGFIYGPGERAWMPRLIYSLRSGKVMLIDGGTRETNVIYVENLALAVELSILNERAFGQTFNLTDGKTPTKKQLFDTICDELGLPRVKKNIPRGVAKSVCELVSAVAPMLPADSRKNLARFSRAAFRLAGVNQGFSTVKAERELGFTELIPFEQGMARTLKHFGTASPSPVAVTSG